MKIVQCDCCDAKVNDYGRWYNDNKPRNMYELKLIHDFDSDTYDGMIVCQKCLQRLLCQKCLQRLLFPSGGRKGGTVL